MKTVLKYLAFITLSLFVLTTYGYAEVRHTKKSLVDWIVNDSKQRVQRLQAEVIVASVIKHAQRENLDPFLIVSLIKHESGFNPQARSGYGARGLMQVVPRFHRDKIKGRLITNIDTNIEVGAKVLGDCIRSRQGHIRKALHCYSGGARRYTEKLAGSYAEIKRHDVLFRFENQYPVTVKSAFHKPQEFQFKDTPESFKVAGI